MIASLFGALLPVMVLNSISVAGMSLSLLYVLSTVKGVFSLWSRLSKGNSLFVFLFFVLLLKSFIYLEWSYDEILKLGVAFAFYNVLYAMKKEFRMLLNAFNVTMLLGIVYAIYQYTVLVLGLDQAGLYAVLPVERWNENLWHMNLVRDDFVRVSSFALEPAYFTIFLAFGLMLNVTYYPKKKILTIIFVLGILMAMSRNGIIFLSVFVLLYHFRNKVGLAALSVALAVSYTFPVLGSMALDLAAYDVSVVARMAPLKIFFFSDSTNVLQLLFGVVDYSDFISSSYEYGIFSEIFESERLLIDPKSFLSNMLYGYGMVGVVGMYVLLLRNFGSCKLCLIMLVSFNLVAFNVNVLYWPVMWVFYLALILIKRDVGSNREA